MGNISSEQTGDYTKRYFYDDLNRLVRADDPTVGRSYKYDYDNRGNLLRYYTYAYTTGNLGEVQSVNTYTYGNTQWKDQLTSYKVGDTAYQIEYDAAGNPTKWAGGKLFSWTNGRRLSYVTVPGEGNYTYKYDSDGLRTAKLNGADTQYYILNGRYVGEKTVVDGRTFIISYLYDENGSPIGITVNRSPYYFIKNIQGDVIGIVNLSGNVIANYTYDAWGKPISVYGNNGDITGATQVGNLNPFRYRGYMYDQETGLYYVNSRYYDAIVGRWLNGDFTGTLDIGFENFAQYNFYVYCWNNPIGMSDPFGTWPNWDTFGKGLLQAAVGVLAVAAVIGTGGTCAPLVALGYAAVATAGVVATGIGASEVYESFSGTNPVRTYLGEPLYDTYKYGSMTVISFSPQIIEMGAQAVCFVAGTIVAAENEQIPIEDVVPGIKVWAYDPDTNRTELKEVVRTFVNETSELVHIKVNNEEIVTTPSHPFYVPKKGWTDAIQLRAGDRLQLLNGEYVIIEQVQHELLETPITVYNFEVEDFHTYYVADTSVLVHNTCGPNGTYEKASYHNNGNSVKSAAPINGQLALDNSVSIGANTSRRIGISDGQFVVLDMTTNGIFHGHVRTWNELTQSMKNALINAGMTNRKGKILG